MGSGRISDDVIKSLVGRAVYDGPVCSRIKNTQLNTSLPDGYIDRLFVQEDDDVHSMSSFVPSTAPTELDNVSHRLVPQRVPPPVSNSRNTGDNQSLKSSSSETQSQMSSDSGRGSHVAVDSTSNYSTTHNSSETSQNSQCAGGKLESIRRKPNLKKSHRRPSTTNGTPLRRSLSPQDVIKEGEILNVSPTNETIHEVQSPVSRPLVVFDYCMCVYTSRVVAVLLTWRKCRDIRSPQCHLQGCMRLCRYLVCVCVCVLMA